jgi:hypothetical protein
LFVDLNSTDYKKKISALAVLNRLNRLITDSKHIMILERILEEGAFDRGLVASTIRAIGDEGEAVLLKLLRSNQNNKAKLPIISVLPWKVP